MSADKIKRKRTVVTIQQKLEAIKKIDAGAKLSDIARELGVSATSVGDWNRNRKRLEEFAMEKVPDGKRKSMKPASYPKTDKAVHEWFVEQVSAGTHVSGRMVLSMAKAFSETFPGEEKFVASEGWLGKWKIRYGIQFSGDQLPAGHVSPATMCATELQDEIKKEEVYIKQEVDGQEEKESQEYKCEPDEQLVLPADGYQALETALKFVEQQPSATSADVEVLRKWRDYAALYLT